MQIIQKVNYKWGYARWWALNEQYYARQIFIRRFQQSETFCHATCDKTIFVINGSLTLVVNKIPIHLTKNDFFRIKPGTPHIYWAEKKVCLFTEVGTHEDESSSC